jgi:hypothetical protein
MNETTETQAMTVADLLLQLQSRDPNDWVHLDVVTDEGERRVKYLVNVRDQPGFHAVALDGGDDISTRGLKPGAKLSTRRREVQCDDDDDDDDE